MAILSPGRTRRRLPAPTFEPRPFTPTRSDLQRRGFLEQPTQVPGAPVPRINPPEPIRPFTPRARPVIQPQAPPQQPVGGGPGEAGGMDGAGGAGGPPSEDFINNVIGNIFGERPQLAFLGNLAQSGLRPQTQKFFRGQAGDFLNRFQQAIGQQLVQGQLPSLTPQEFFGNIDFGREQFNFTPRQRGVARGSFAPRTRFLR